MWGRTAGVDVFRELIRIRAPLLTRIVQGACRRLVRRADYVIFLATSDSQVLDESGVLRVSGGSSLESRQQVESAMEAAGESVDLVARRFAHGDEFFGRVVGEDIASFGWVTYRTRMIHGLCLKDAPGRAFLYNFHTFVAFRGRGLYPGLLGVIRQQLGREGINEFIIDVEARNSASLDGVGRAGFTIVAHAVFLIFLDQWYWPYWQSAVAGMLQEIFLT